MRRNEKDCLTINEFSRMIQVRYILLFVVLLATSCSIYKKYDRPEQITATGAFGTGVEESADSISIANIHWKNFFTDKRLQMLIKKALENNRDMKVASQRILASEATLKSSRLGFLPTVAFAPGVSYSNAPQYSNESKYGYELPLKVSWEVDIFGKQLNKKRRSLSAYRQSLLYKQSVQTEVISGVANCYYTLLMLDAQLAVSEKTAATWKKNVETMRAMKEAGMTNAAAISQTEANSCSIDASLYDLKYKINQVENSLALILGEPSRHFERGNLYEQVVNDSFAVGTPVSLLSHRPDVRMAEEMLEQAYYATNIARSAFYPSLTISGDGLWSKALTSPAGWFVSLAAKLVQPIFMGGANRANLKIAKAQQEEALINFQQIILKAGSEVNDAIAKCRTAQGKKDVRERQIAALESAVYSTRQLMSHSESTYLEVLTAQQSLLSAQLLQISDRFDEIQGFVYLYKALGGGSED